MTRGRDSSLESFEFLAFDIETTGLSPQADAVVEIGAVRFRHDGTEIDRFWRLVNPDRPIPWRALQIHGISDDMVRDAPPIGAVLPEFLRFLGSAERTMLMAHNASFDRGFLERAIARAGFPQPTHELLDTIRLARSRTMGLGSYSLGSLVRHFQLDSGVEHRGLSDAIVLKDLFALLIAQAPTIATRDDLLACCPPARRFSARGGGRSGRRDWSPRSRTPVANTPDVAIDPQLRVARSALQAAVERRTLVQIVYDGGRSAGTPRVVRPLRLFDSGARSYLLAFCERDQIEKHFRLDRVREVFDA